MRPQTLKQLEKLIKMLELEGYTVIPTIRDTPDTFLINIKLKDGDAEQIMANCINVRRIEGG